MKDLAEAELIDMERRVLRLLSLLEDDPDEMSRMELNNAFEVVRDRLATVARDTERLCNHVRTLCAPSR